MGQTEIVRDVISLTVNGESRSLRAGTTLAEFLRDLNLNPQLLVVEHNGEIVRDRSLFSVTTLDDGDTLELVHFVGGG
jgi:thiamine biosynthesis protein ThiS